MIKCEICGSSKMSNFSFKEDFFKSVKHYYCKSCGGHYYRDKWITKERWFDYINDDKKELKSTKLLSDEDIYNINF